MNLKNSKKAKNNMRVITFSRFFPAYHPKAGQPTYFVEKIWKSLDELLPIEKAFGDDFRVYDIVEYNKIGNVEPKHHTIRAGKRWKVGDKFSPRVWSGKPYRSKMITIAPDIEIKKVWYFEIEVDGDYICVLIDGKAFYEENTNFKTQTEALDTLAKNDGLTTEELLQWFQYPKAFSGQIISWNENIEY